MNNQNSHILLVEDEDILADGILFNLKKNGYTVDWVKDGKAALEAFVASKYNLILLDIMMPDIKGYEVCEKIKTNPDTKDIKIMVLSAYLDEEKFKKMKEYGADACFSKPLLLPQLKQEVCTLLGLEAK